MLDPAVIACRRPRGLDTKLHHKDPIARERRLGWVHGRVLRYQGRHNLLHALFTWRGYNGAPVHAYSRSVQREGRGPIEVLKYLFILSMTVHTATQETPWSRGTTALLG